ncbi:uncharacterized protein KD926_005901 [Aspergillus affinis]|uniref:uncharacterized protein n=1 Tax=Aspergillus affinis TaxID=1070780 RepID=UPI0022FEAD21|nr:uncharacterized protein KD926_005901 [Aspergillus affinis]KAI9045957.1 hypothetical protein KD926_005901 [Aspergillus affinis]
MNRTREEEEPLVWFAVIHSVRFMPVISANPSLFYHNALSITVDRCGNMIPVDKYCRVRWEPYTSTEKRTCGLALIKDHWKSLAQAGFDTVDAIFTVQGVEDKLYFFRGLEVVRIKFKPKSGGDTIAEGPLKILDKWKSLAGTKVDRVGVAIAVPGVPNQAYFFSGPNYVKIDVVKDTIMYWPAAIAKEWPALTKAGFDSVDAALQYARVQVVPSKPDVLRWGLAKWEDHWKSLDWIANQPSAPRTQTPPPGSQGQAGSGAGAGGSQGQPAPQPKPKPSKLLISG